MTCRPTSGAHQHVADGELWKSTETGRQYAATVQRINDLESSISQLTDKQLADKTCQFRARLAPSEWPEPTDFQRAGIVSYPSPPSEALACMLQVIVQPIKLLAAAQAGLRSLADQLELRRWMTFSQRPSLWSGRLPSGCWACATMTCSW